MPFFLTSFYLTVSQSEVFAVAFALLAAGAVILTLNVLLLVIASFSLSSSTHILSAELFV